MNPLANPSNSELFKLDAIVQNLGLGKHWKGPGMLSEIVEACEQEAAAVLAGALPRGELIADTLASHYSVKFEEVNSTSDINVLEDRYLRKKKEIGFGRLRRELSSPGVDALLFHRINARAEEPDQWVAVLNLMATADRAYWNRFHELSHRVAEPPQLLLAFRRELSGKKGAVEYLIDAVAGQLAFHKSFFDPLVLAVGNRPLDFDLITELRDTFSPTASLLSVANAVAARWPRPALTFTASFRGKRSSPDENQALRIQRQCTNSHARNIGLMLYDNMRVPTSSFVYRAFATGTKTMGYDRCVEWSTSDGSHLLDVRAIVSALPLGKCLYGVMSL